MEKKIGFIGSSYRRADSGIHRAGKDTGMV